MILTTYLKPLCLAIFRECVPCYIYLYLYKGRSSLFCQQREHEDWQWFENGGDKSVIVWRCCALVCSHPGCLCSLTPETTSHYCLLSTWNIRYLDQYDGHTYIIDKIIEHHGDQVTKPAGSGRAYTSTGDRVIHPKLNLAS